MKKKDTQGDQLSLRLVFESIMSLFYIVLSYLLIFTELFSHMMDRKFRILFAVLFTIYGLYRVYRAIRKLKAVKKLPEIEEENENQ